MGIPLKPLPPSSNHRISCSVKSPDWQILFPSPSGRGYHRTKTLKLSGGGWEGNSTAGRDSWSHVFSFLKDKNLHESNEKSGTMQEF